MRAVHWEQGNSVRRQLRYIKPSAVFASLQRPRVASRQVEGYLRDTWGSHATTRPSRSAVQRPNLAPVIVHRRDAASAQLSDLA